MTMCLISRRADALLAESCRRKFTRSRFERHHRVFAIRTHSTICSDLAASHAELRTVCASTAVEEYAEIAGAGSFNVRRQPAVSVYHGPDCSSSSPSAAVREPFARRQTVGRAVAARKHRSEPLSADVHVDWQNPRLLLRKESILQNDLPEKAPLVDDNSAH